MKKALVLGGYHESVENGRVPPPGNFIREVYVDHRCALARDFMPGEKKFAYVDFVVTSPDGRVVFLEVDEEQHWSYPVQCETARMANVTASIALAGLDMNVFWLRFNPDSPFNVARIKTHPEPMRRREEVVRFLDGLKSSPSDPPFQVGYACYDCAANGYPDILYDPEYHDEIKSNVVCITKGGHKLFQPKPFEPVDPMFADRPNFDLDLPSDDEGPSVKVARVE